MVAWNGVALLPDCLDAVLAQVAPFGARVMVVDNASTDGTAELVASRWPSVDLVRSPVNLGFAGGAALGLDRVKTPFAVLLNQDARPAAGWLVALLAPLADAAVAAVTSKVLFSDGGLVNNTGVVVRADGYGYDRGFEAADDGAFDAPCDVFAFSGTACALRMDAVRAVGGMDASFFLYYEDTDLSWRLRLAGWRIRYAPQAVVSHLHGASTSVGSALFAFHNERNRLLMLAKNAPLGLFVVQVLRFIATTVLLPVRRLRGVEVPAGPQFTVRLRVRVLGSLVRLLPSSLAARRRMRPLVRVPRRVVVRELEGA